MGQTRINLKHLLEDIRDGYPFPEEETIITELVANALDSGASTAWFEPHPALKTLTVRDDGNGMARGSLKSYHDIASSTKVRGKGIGFAGIGAKLSLLICESVTTESRCGRSHHATRWHLESSMRAPWRFVEPQGRVPEGSNGTAISFHLASGHSKLLEVPWLEDVLRRHFEPLLNPRFVEAIYGRLYRRPFAFIVAGRGLEGEAAQFPPERSRFFPIHLGAKRTLAGFGWMGTSPGPLPGEKRGLGAATYGKVIKRGWEWLGIRPGNPERITGMIEIPGWAALLTTNKADFLKDSASLKQYYRYRKAILKMVEPALRELGEWEETQGSSPLKTYPSQREIEQVVAGLVGDFPELKPLLDTRRRAIPGVGEGDVDRTGAAPMGPEGQEAVGRDGGEKSTEAGAKLEEPAGETPTDEAGSPKKPAGLKITFDLRPDRPEMGWLSGTTVCVNQAHPAYRRAVQSRSESYHMAVTVAWVLSQYVEHGKPLPEFINRFLDGWGREG
jgi:hypothetical protein